MTEKPTETPRGEAAWRAQRDAIAKRNDAVRDRAQRDRAVRNAEEVARRRREERTELDSLPEQPRPL